MDITMPQLGETVTEGTVTRWLKQVGDEVAPDELIFEVSTDKVDSEVPAPGGGYLVEILVPEGETVPVGTKPGRAWATPRRPKAAAMAVTRRLPKPRRRPRPPRRRRRSPPLRERRAGGAEANREEPRRPRSREAEEPAAEKAPRDRGGRRPNRNRSKPSRRLRRRRPARRVSRPKRRRRPAPRAGTATVRGCCCPRSSAG